MPSFNSGGFGSSGARGGGWERLHGVDFTALTPTSWGPGDVGVDQIVDGEAFRPIALASGTASVGGASGLRSTNNGSQTDWLFGAAAGAGIDITGENRVAFVSTVYEANPWAGQAGLQFGQAADGNFDPGGDFLRINSTSYQAARRQSGTSANSYGVPLPGASGPRRLCCIVGKQGSHLRYIATGGTGSLDHPDPDDASWSDAGGAAVNNTGLWPFNTNADNHLQVWYSGATDAQYRVLGCSIFRLLGAVV